MFILEPGVLFQRKTNLIDDWKKVRIGIIGSFTNLVDANGTPNAETLTTQSNLTNVPIIGMSNGVGYPGTAGNKCIGVRGGFDADAGTSANTQMSFSTPNWLSSCYTQGNSLLGNEASVYTAYPNAGAWHNWRIGDPTATSSCMFWFVLELDVNTSGTLKQTWWHSNLTPLSNASDATLMGLITNPAGYTGNATSGLTTLVNANAWWTAAPVACPYFFIRMPYLTNRLRIMNMNIIDGSLYL